MALAVGIAVFISSVLPVGLGAPTPAFAATFKEPGMLSLKGAAEVGINLLNEPNKITSVMVQMAIKEKARDIDAYVRQEWDQIGRNPVGSKVFNGLMLITLQRALAQPATRAEAEMAEAFKGYIRASNVRAAQAALDAYYEWKRNPNPSNNVGLQSLFNYGDVPIDFEAKVRESVNTKLVSAGMVSATATVSAAIAAQTAAVTVGQSAAYAGALAIQTAASTGAPLMSQAATQAAAQALATISGTGAAAAAGAVVGAALILAVSVDRLIQITQAEAKLKEAVKKANQPFMPQTYEVLLTKWAQLTSEDFTPSIDQSRLGTYPDPAQVTKFFRAANDLNLRIGLVGWKTLTEYDCVPGRQMGQTCTNRKTGAVVSSDPAYKQANASMLIADPNPSPKFSTIVRPMASMIAWDNVPGNADDIGIGKDGSVWITSNSDYIYRLGKNGWQQVGGQGVRLSVGPDGNPWLVNRAKQIFHYDGRKWIEMPGNAQDVGVGPDGTVWITGLNDLIYRRDGNMWRQIGGQGVRIAVAPDGNPWLVNKAGKIFRYDGRKWDPVVGQANDIGVGADGNVWCINNNGVYVWNGSSWDTAKGNGLAIAGAPGAKAWVVGLDRKIYKVR